MGVTLYYEQFLFRVCLQDMSLGGSRVVAGSSQVMKQQQHLAFEGPPNVAFSSHVVYFSMSNNLLQKLLWGNHGRWLQLRKARLFLYQTTHLSGNLSYCLCFSVMIQIAEMERKMKWYQSTPQARWCSGSFRWVLKPCQTKYMHLYKQIHTKNYQGKLMTVLGEGSSSHPQIKQ